jgi:TRAP-type C4-dicarboxylate transport system substrate-binding protein
MVHGIRRPRRLANIAAAVAGTVALTACGGGGGDADAGGGGGGESIQLTLAAGHPAGGAITYTNYAQSFLVPEIERRVEEETDHTIEIDEQYGGTVASLADVLEATQSGLVDIGLVNYPFEPSELYLFNASYFVPFGSPDIDVVMQAAREAFDAHPEMAELLEEKFNQRVLGFSGVGDYGLISTFEVTGVDSLRGRKLSAAGPNLPWISAVGATPVQGNLNEWYNAFQTGVYDGGILFVQSYAGFKLYEVAPNFTKTGFGAIWLGGIHVNLDSFEALPEDVQKIIEEVSREYEDTFPEAVAADDERALAILEENGIELAEFPQEERRAWAEQLADIPAERAAEADDQGLPGTSFLETYIEAMKDAGYEFPYEYDLG